MLQRLLVLSDLHLAPPGPLTNLRAGDALAALLHHLGPELTGTTLVLAGDTFDLLQTADGSETLAPAEALARLTEVLEGIAATEWGAAGLAGLGRLVRRGGRVVVLPGNHDPELFHPESDALLRRMCGLTADEPGLRIDREPTPWATDLGRRSVVIGHGHRGDPWNDLDPLRVRDALTGAGPPCPLPPGSQLVRRTLNVFKAAVDPRTGAPRFRFLDLLKPELPGVALLLLYLDPGLALTHLPGVGRLSGRLLLRSLRRRLTGGPVLALAQDGTQAAEFTAAEQVAAALTEALLDALDPAERAAPLATITGWVEDALNADAPPAPGTLITHGRRRWLRWALRHLSHDGTFFDRGATSRTDRAILERHLPPGSGPKVVVAGHTHAARQLLLLGEQTYLNCGTWTELMRFPLLRDDQETQTWIEQLEAGTAPTCRALTYSEITAEGAALREWCAPSPPGYGPW